MEETSNAASTITDYEKHELSLRRIAIEMGVPIKPELKYSVRELEDLILKAIHVKTIQGKNLRKRLKELERKNEPEGFWADGTIGGRFHE